MNNLVEICSEAGHELYYVYKPKCKSHMIHIKNSKKTINSVICGLDFDEVLELQNEMLKTGRFRDRMLFLKDESPEVSTFEDLL